MDVLLVPHQQLQAHLQRLGLLLVTDQLERCRVEEIHCHFDLTAPRLIRRVCLPELPARRQCSGRGCN